MVRYYGYDDLALVPSIEYWLAGLISSDFSLSSRSRLARCLIVNLSTPCPSYSHTRSAPKNWGKKTSFFATILLEPVLMILIGYLAWLSFCMWCNILHRIVHRLWLRRLPDTDVRELRWHLQQRPSDQLCVENLILNEKRTWAAKRWSPKISTVYG